MRPISYRWKLRLKTAGKVLLILAAILIVLTVLLLIFMQRYLVFTSDGVHLDFSRAVDQQITETAGPNPTLPPVESVEIIYQDPPADQAEIISGYYITIGMLQDPEAAFEAVKELEEPCTVLIDLKSSSGNFYYRTSLADAPLAEVDISVIEEMITYLRDHGFHTIARIEAFKDSRYALEHRDAGLSIRGGPLWSDQGYYWIDPGNETVIAYLEQIIKDLAGRGFREVVLDDFYFPSDNSIVYNSEKTGTAIIDEAAATLLRSFSSTNVTVSFCDAPVGIKVSNPNSRLYIPDAEGQQVKDTLSAATGLSDPEKQLAFLTDSRDTRFDGYSVLRPLTVR